MLIRGILIFRIIFEQLQETWGSEKPALIWGENMRKDGKHLTLEERREIKTLLDQGVKVYRIAEKMNRAPKTIYLELKRGSVNGGYDPFYSQSRYQDELERKGPDPKIRQNPRLAQYIANKILDEGLSPEQIVACLRDKHSEKLETVTIRTIYTAIDQGLIPNVTRDDLRQNEVKMFNRGCVTIPIWLREKYGFNDGDRFRVKDNGGGIVLEKVDYLGKEADSQ